MLLRNVQIESMIGEYYGTKVLSAYRCLMPYSYKADLAKYCLLHAVGGLYIDIGVRWRSKFNIEPNTDLVAFRDIQKNSNTSWACSCGIIFAKPEHPALRLAIEKTVYNIENKIYGHTPLCPTGPPVWGSALAASKLNLMNSVFGDFVALTPNNPIKNYAFVMPSGQILADWKPDLGSRRLSDISPEGTNDYNVLWGEGRIYSS
jgi:mannosyltransferase OCH1-like enzyme